MVKRNPFKLYEKQKMKLNVSQMKILKIMLKGDDYEPTKEELDYISFLGEKKSIKILKSLESNLKKIKFKKQDGV